MASYRPQFAVASLSSLGATLYFSLFGPGAGAASGAARTAALATLTTACALLIFVIP